MAETNSARALPSGELKRVALKATLPNKVSDPLKDSANEGTSIFDESCIRAGMTNNDDIAEAAIVHKSAVSKWRSEHYTDTPNLTQLVRLARRFPLFAVALHRVLGQRFGARRTAMRSLLEAVADLATCFEDEQERTG